MKSRFETLVNSNKGPWLIYTHGSRNRPKQTLYCLAENKYYETMLSIIGELFMYQCSYGWFMMLDSLLGDCFLFNPVTMAKIELPNWGDSGFVLYCCDLSHPDPNDPNCIVLASSRRTPGVPYVRFCKPAAVNHNSDDRWRDKALEKPRYDDPGMGLKDATVSSLVRIGDKFYGLDMYGVRLMVFEYDAVGDNGCGSVNLIKGNAEGNKEELIVVPRPSMCGTAQYDKILVELGGELCLVIVSFWGSFADKIRIIKVKKFDMDTLKWKTVKNLGDWAIFVICGVDRYGHSCLASEFGVKQNCLYCLLDDDKNLYIYDLEESSITTMLPCPQPFKNWRNTVWVFPAS